MTDRAEWTERLVGRAAQHPDGRLHAGYYRWVDTGPDGDGWTNHGRDYYVLADGSALVVSWADGELNDEHAIPAGAWVPESPGRVSCGSWGGCWLRWADRDWHASGRRVSPDDGYAAPGAAS